MCHMRVTKAVPYGFLQSDLNLAFRHYRSFQDQKINFYFFCCVTLLFFGNEKIKRTYIYKILCLKIIKN